MRKGTQASEKEKKKAGNFQKIILQGIDWVEKCKFKRLENYLDLDEKDGEINRIGPLTPKGK